MRTLVIAKRFRPPWQNGIVSYTRGLVSVLSHISTIDSQEPIDVLPLKDKTSSDEKWSEELKRFDMGRGFRVVSPRDDTGNPLSRRKALRAVGAKGDYDTVHIAFAGLDPLAVNMIFKSRSLEKKPKVFKHLFVAPMHYHWLLEKYYYRTLKGLGICPELFFAFSCPGLQRLYGIADNLILPPAIDTDFYRPKSVSRNHASQILEDTSEGIGDLDQVLSKDRIVLYMGPVTRDRFPFETLSGAFSLDGNKLEETGLLVIGRGFEKEAFLQEISEKMEDQGLNSRMYVTLKCLTEEEKRYFFNLCDVFFYPFLRDRLSYSVVVPPIALLEVMACGTTVLTGGFPLIHEMIEDEKNGFLVHDASPEHTARTLVRALDATSGDTGGLARQTVIDRYSIESVASRLREYHRKTENTY